VRKTITTISCFAINGPTNDDIFNAGKMINRKHNNTAVAATSFNTSLLYLHMRLHTYMFMSNAICWYNL